MFPKRVVFCVSGFLCSTLAVLLNTNLSMAIVSMVDRDNRTSTTRTANECRSGLDPDGSQEAAVVYTGEMFHWSPETEGWALGAVYFGQLLGFVPGGRAAERWGGRRTLLAALLLASVCTAATPLAAALSVHAFVACRFLVGVGTAPVIPVLFHLMSRWIPEGERSLAASFVLAGYGTGTFASFLSSGVLCASAWGWPAVFYAGGACGFSWCLLCYLLVFDSPEQHPSIGAVELAHISSHLGAVRRKEIKRIPWRPMLCSVPFWSLALGYFGQFWILGFYSTVQTLYMGTILHLDSATNGELSCVAPLARGLFACACGFPTDWALRKGRVGKGFVRKGATLVNAVFSCAGFAAIAMAGCDPLLNATLFTAGGLLADFVTFGVCMAAVDIAPNLSGTVSGILSFIGVIPFFAIPAWVGFTTQNERSMAQWRYVYCGSIGVVLVTTLVYLLFGTSEPQAWGTDDDSPEDEGLTKEKDQGT